MSRWDAAAVTAVAYAELRSRGFDAIEIEVSANPVRAYPANLHLFLSQRIEGTGLRIAARWCPDAGTMPTESDIKEAVGEMADSIKLRMAQLPNKLATVGSQPTTEVLSSMLDAAGILPATGVSDGSLSGDPPTPP